MSSDLLETVTHVTSDESRWRRRVGLTDERVFVCAEDGFYKDLRAALFRRGWRQAAWGSTPHWSLAIALKPTDIEFTTLRPGQAVNNFEGSSSLCNKSMLVATLAANAAALPVAMASFFPRAFDLDELHDYAAFVDDFRATAAEGVLRAVALAALRASEGGDGGRAAALFLRALDSAATTGSSRALRSLLHAPSVCASVARLPLNIGVVRAAARVTARRAPNFDDDGVLDCAVAADEPPLISDREWQAIRWCSAFVPGGPADQAPATRAREATERAGVAQSARPSGGTSSAVLAQLNAWRERALRDASTPGAVAALRATFDPNVGMAEPTPTSEGDAFDVLTPVSDELWGAIVTALCCVAVLPGAQSTLLADRAHNVWIVKPSGKSRGRGIECETELARILARRGAEAGATKAAGGGGFIAQKYIERPLCVHDRKFDIRQWALVTSWAPLEVWVFTRPYLRLCAVPYELSNVGDRFAHLSNNSVQKHSAAFGSVGDGNMWHAADFAQWLEEQDAAGAWTGLEYCADAALLPRPGDGLPTGRATLPVSGCGDVWGLVVEPRIHSVVLHTLLCGQDSMGSRATSNSGSWEQYGFDVMVDAALRVWLIEVNSAPDMSYSTAVTAALVPEASDGIAAVTCEWTTWASGGRRGAEPSTGAWRRIYAAPSAAAINSTSCTARGLAVTGTALAPPARGRAPAAVTPALVTLRPHGSARSASPRPPTAAAPAASAKASAGVRESTSMPPRPQRVDAAAFPLPRAARSSAAGGGARAVRALISTLTPLTLGRAVLQFSDVK
jgi:tubulin monoglycylase TTLL3/8